MQLLDQPLAIAMDSRSLFTAALGQQAPWKVDEVSFDPAEGHIDFYVGFQRGAHFTCPSCGAEEQAVHDTLDRTWRHLNFFQYQAYLHAKVPRVHCRSCGKISQVEVPWARPGSGFSQLMEALVVTLCKAMTVSEVAQLLSVGPMRIWRILDHYVEAARAQENFLQVRAVVSGRDRGTARSSLHQPVPRSRREASAVRLRWP